MKDGIYFVSITNGNRRPSRICRPFFSKPKPREIICEENTCLGMAVTHPSANISNLCLTLLIDNTQRRPTCWYSTHDI